MSQVDRDLGRRILTELRSATNQPLRHDATSHPFWTSLNIEKPPEKIVIATSSYRKIALFTLQFLALNKEAMPPFFEEYGKNPLTFLRTLKKAFHNGNNESTGEYYVGELFGVPIYAQATEGEKHDEQFNQRDEAYHKAVWLAAQNQGKDSRNTWYVGVDTLDTIWIDDGTRLKPLPKMPKPSGWPDFPKDWQENQTAYHRFKRKAIAERFPQGGTLQGVTAGAIVDGALEERSIGAVTVETQIDQMKLLSVISEFDPNASAFGVLQLLIDWETEGGLEDSEVLEKYFPHLSPEQQRIAAFFLLAQIMGAPAMLILELVASAHPGMKEEEKEEVLQVLQLPPASAGTA
ncbi:hypothetical protein H3C70_00940 [Patescibacteria group bacterium]|nr:hypothetical protein [Patescibacteria group bacterium]